MATFPALKTGAVAQYPLGRGVSYSTQAVRFLDGSQQKFRLIGNGLRRWIIKLDLLDEDELNALIAFVDEQGSGTFSFVDPVTGDAVKNCILSGDSFEVAMKGEMDGQAEVVIQELA